MSLHSFLFTNKKAFPSNGITGKVYIGQIDYYNHKSEMDKVKSALDNNAYVANGSVNSWYHHYHEWAFKNHISDMKDTNCSIGKNLIFYYIIIFINFIGNNIPEFQIGFTLTHIKNSQKTIPFYLPPVTIFNQYPSISLSIPKISKCLMFQKKKIINTPFLLPQTNVI